MGDALGSDATTGSPDMCQGQAEVQDLDPVIRGDLDVRRLQIAMDDPLLVGLLQPFGDLAAQRNALT